LIPGKNHPWYIMNRRLTSCGEKEKTTPNQKEKKRSLAFAAYLIMLP
jgi:hypothetical protein